MRSPMRYGRAAPMQVHKSRTLPTRTAERPASRIRPAVIVTPTRAGAGTTLLINTFSCVHAIRGQEYMSAFISNLNNTAIDRIILFSRTGDRRYQAVADQTGLMGKIRMYSGYRGDAVGVPSYQDFFTAAMMLCRRGDPVIVANLDVYFDHTINRLRGFNLDGKFLAVSRLDIGHDGIWRAVDKRGSQDAWIFTTPVKIPGSEKVYLGRCGCDNKIAWLAQEAGYTVYDPGNDIAVYHRHASEVRFPRRKQKVPGPYLCFDRGTLIPSDEQLQRNEVK